MAFYWFGDKIVTCKWKNNVKPFFKSNNKFFIGVEGLVIFNDPNKQS